MKRLTSLLLAVMIIFTAFPVSAIQGISDADAEFGIINDSDVEKSDDVIDEIIEPETEYSPYKPAENFAEGDYSESQVIVKLHTSAGGVSSFSAQENSLSAGEYSRFFQSLGVDVLETETLMTIPNNEAPVSLFRSRSVTREELVLLTLENPGKENVLETIEKLETIPEVEYAEPDYIVTLEDTVDEVVPNDPFYKAQYGLGKINANAAWNVTKGDSEVVVAVIDSGIDYNHTDLADNIWINPNPGLSGYADDIHGWNFVDNNNDIMDDRSHGTHVAGIIGAVGNNGIGVTGVSWDVKLMGLKVLGEDGKGVTSNIIKAVNYAEKMGADISNNSYGNAENSRAFKDAIAGCNHLFVASAGNTKANNDIIIHNPSNYECDNIISVAATTGEDTLSGTSNYGVNTVHVAAPGSNIYSTIPNNGYGYKTGTSMAAPHVTGVAALILSVEPNLSSTEIKDRLMANSDPVEALKNQVMSGGRINAYKSLFPAGHVPLESISINSYINTLGKSDRLALSIKFLPENTTQRAISWSSSNSNIVRVTASGTITAVSPGTATIMAVSKSDPRIKDEYTFTVRQPDPGSDFAGGDGTAENPYQVSKPEQLNNVRRYLDSYFIQINDIDMGNATSAGGEFYNNGKGWISIGAPYNNDEFRGNYDGGGYSIIDLYADGRGQVSSDESELGTRTYIGLFGMNYLGTIKNVNIKGGTIKNGFYTGAVVARNAGEMENCSNSAHVFVEENIECGYLGGVAGTIDDSTQLVSNCYNSGEIEYLGYHNSDMTTFVGGITGTNYASLMTDCGNEGDITVKPSRYTALYIGGVVGKSSDNSITKAIFLKNCYNNGSLYLSGTEDKSRNYVIGGVAGQIYSSSKRDWKTKALEAENLYNTGNITIGGNSARIGGITGELWYSVIANCYNTGTIESASSPREYSGGIAGVSFYSQVENCYNAGSVIGSQGSKNVGHVFGYVSVGSYSVQSVYYIYSEKIRAIGNVGSVPNGLEGKTSEQLKEISTFTGWDFYENWSIAFDINQGYPYLSEAIDYRIEGSESDIVINDVVKGTPFGELDLPLTAKALYKGGAGIYEYLPVKWNENDYDSSKFGIQFIEGYFDLSSVDYNHISNPDLIKINATVIMEGSITVDYSPASLTNGDVTATLNVGDGIIIENNGGLNTYVFTENGSFEFRLKNSLGSLGLVKAEVNWIDKIPPTADMKYTTTKPTNQNVTATIVFNEDVTITNNGGNSSYTFTENGTFTFEFKDKAGNTGSATAVVNNIDRISPSATIQYSITTPTINNVTATIIPSEDIVVMNNNGRLYYTFSENGSFTFEFEDLAGNAGSITAVVGNINKSTEYRNISSSTATKVTDIIRGTPFEELGMPAQVKATLSGGGTAMIDVEWNKDTYNPVLVKAQIIRGEFVNLPENILNPSKRMPLAMVTVIHNPNMHTVSYSSRELTNQDVMVTLAFSEPVTIISGYEWLSKTSDTSYNAVFSENGQFDVTYEDEFGERWGPASIAVDWIDKTPPMATVEYSTTELTSTDVAATITFSEAVTITRGGENLIQSQADRLVYTAVFSENGSLDIEFEDAATNQGEKLTLNVDNIDESAPAGMISYDINILTNQNVTASLIISDELTITNNGGSNKYVFTQNGSFEFHVRNLSGETGVVSAVVDWIDKSSPMATVSYNITDSTKGNVTATMTFSEPVKITSGGEELTQSKENPLVYTLRFIKNGSYDVEFEDMAGNSGEKINLTVGNIDNTYPTATVWYDTKSPTKGNVNATVTFSEPVIITSGNERLIQSLTDPCVYTAVFTDSGYFTVKYKDNVGNTGNDLTLRVDNIDKIPPTAIVEYNIVKPTRNNVVATIIPSEEIIVTNNEGSMAYTFTENGSFTFDFKDMAGNTGSVTALVSNIDEEINLSIISIPVMRLINIPRGISFKDIGLPKQLDIMLSDGGTKLLDVKWDDSNYKADMVGTQVVKGSVQNLPSYITNVNNRSASILITNIATSTYSIQYSLKTWTNQDVTSTFTFLEPVTITSGGDKLNKINETTYGAVFTENDSFDVCFADKDGRDWGPIPVTVSWIDKTAPVATVEYSTTDPTNSDVTAKITFSEEVIITKGGERLSQSQSDSLVYTALFANNGVFDIEYRDKAGNNGEKLTLNVQNIDKPAPVGTISYDISTLTNQSVTATLKVTEDITITNNDGSNKYTFTQNGSFDFKIENDIGITSTVTASVDWIDKTAPTATVSYNVTGLTNGNVIATIIPSEDITVTNNGGSHSYTFIKNGTFKFEFKDAAGNKGSVTAAVNNIDKVAPTATVTYNITGLTNGNVIATIIPSEEITVTNNGGSQSYTFIKNGTFKFEFRDAAGNKGSVAAAVNNIDKTAPTVVVEYSTAKPTNSDVTASITFSEEVSITKGSERLIQSQADNLVYTAVFTENDSFDIEYKDKADNIGEKLVLTVGNIDKSLPTGTISYDVSSLTNQSVTATLEVAEDITIMNNGGSHSYIFTENGSFEFQIKNAAGTTGTVAASVNWIDKTVPTATVNYNITGLTNRDVVATIAPSEDITVINNGGSLSYVFAQNGVFEFEFKDNAGNKGSVTAAVSNIDKTVPTAEVSYSTKDSTDGNVTATIIPSEDIIVTNNGGNSTYTFTENGSFTFDFQDLAGNAGSAKATVTWIEKIVQNPPPVFSEEVYFTVIFEYENGTGMKTTLEVPGGADIGEMPVPERYGYNFAGWFTEKMGKGTKYTEEAIITNDLTLYAHWNGQDIPAAQKFNDVKAGAWYAKSIEFVYQNGLFGGVSDNKFSPGKNMSRGMLSLVLWRLSGEPETDSNTTTGFTDVKPSAYYANAIKWAADAGIVQGVGSSRFNPSGNITREQLAVMLYRYAVTAGRTISADVKSLEKFSDAGKVSTYAKDAMGWAVETGIIQGKSGKLSPKGKATRAETAAMIMRFAEMLDE